MNLKRYNSTLSQVGYLNWKLNQHVFFKLIISNIKFAAFLPHRSRDVINIYSVMFMIKIQVGSALSQVNKVKIELT